MNKNWKQQYLTRQCNVNPAKTVFRELAVEGVKLLHQAYKDLYGEELDMSQLVLRSDPECHVYYKKGEEEPFFFMSKTTVGDRLNPLTGEEETHACVECRYRPLDGTPTHPDS